MIPEADLDAIEARHDVYRWQDKHMVATCRECDQSWPCETSALVGEVRALRQNIDAALALHRETGASKRYCSRCSFSVDDYAHYEPWPCQTVAALAGGSPEPLDDFDARLIAAVEDRTEAEIIRGGSPEPEAE